MSLNRISIYTVLFCVLLSQCLLKASEADDISAKPSVTTELYDNVLSSVLQSFKDEVGPYVIKLKNNEVLESNTPARFNNVSAIQFSSRNTEYNFDVAFEVQRSGSGINLNALVDTRLMIKKGSNPVDMLTSKSEHVEIVTFENIVSKDEINEIFKELAPLNNKNASEFPQETVSVYVFQNFKKLLNKVQKRIEEKYKTEINDVDIKIKSNSKRRAIAAAIHGVVNAAVLAAVTTFIGYELVDILNTQSSIFNISVFNKIRENIHVKAYGVSEFREHYRYLYSLPLAGISIYLNKLRNGFFGKRAVDLTEQRSERAKMAQVHNKALASLQKFANSYRIKDQVKEREFIDRMTTLVLKSFKKITIDYSKINNENFFDLKFLSNKTKMKFAKSIKKMSLSARVDNGIVEPDMPPTVKYITIFNSSEGLMGNNVVKVDVYDEISELYQLTKLSDEKLVKELIEKYFDAEVPPSKWRGIMGQHATYLPEMIRKSPGRYGEVMFELFSKIASGYSKVLSNVAEVNKDNLRLMTNHSRKLKIKYGSHFLAASAMGMALYMDYFGTADGGSVKNFFYAFEMRSALSHQQLLSAWGVLASLFGVSALKYEIESSKVVPYVRALRKQNDDIKESLGSLTKYLDYKSRSWGSSCAVFFN